jgi:hypothetical protein
VGTTREGLLNSPSRRPMTFVLTQVQVDSDSVASSGLGDSRVSTSFYPPYLRSQTRDS